METDIKEFCRFVGVDAARLDKISVTANGSDVVVVGERSTETFKLIVKNVIVPPRLLGGTYTWSR